MVLPELENLLQQAIGLDVASIGEAMLERAVQLRAAACGHLDQAAYWDWLQRSEDELQELVEAVIVPETWFFRDREAFTALVGVANQAAKQQAGAKALRLLSLPCASGEEPYSMAMALLDAGFAADDFAIDAVDISRQALQRASRAVYGKNSFRGRELGFRARYFEETVGGYRLIDAVRRQVSFQHGNLLAAGFLAGAQPYDVIFCRNLLIYFGRPAQDRAIEVLARSLAATGGIFVGPAETGLLLSHDFVSARLPLAFALYKESKRLKKPRPAHGYPAELTHPTKPHPHRATTPVARPVPAKAGSVRPGPIPVPPSATVDAAGELDEASRLADQGRLDEAAHLCEAYLHTHEPSSRAFYLMGLIHDASDRQAEAVSFYRKALYLDPNHGEALVHLAFLVEKQGDKEGAKRLYGRAKRLQPGDQYR